MFDFEKKYQNEMDLYGIRLGLMLTILPVMISRYPSIEDIQTKQNRLIKIKQIR